MPSSIEWTDESWNPVTGCTRVSPGCDHCYMFAPYPRLRGMGVPGYETSPDNVRLIPEQFRTPYDQRPSLAGRFSRSWNASMKSSLRFVFFACMLTAIAFGACTAEAPGNTQAPDAASKAAMAATAATPEEPPQSGSFPPTPALVAATVLPGTAGPAGVESRYPSSTTVTPYSGCSIPGPMHFGDRMRNFCAQP